MCDQWKTALINDFNPHIVSCVECLHRKLNQSKELTKAVKRNFEAMRKKKEDLLAQMKLLLPEPECSERFKELVINALNISIHKSGVINLNVFAGCRYRLLG